MMIKNFVTDSGIVVPAITTDQMREVDRIAMEETGPNLFQMMENAGHNLALTAMEMMGNYWEQAAYVILAGSGGNGGGGICAAKHLANRGLAVRLVVTDYQRLGDIPQFQRKIFQSTRGREVLLSDIQGESADLIIDAIIGYSLQAAPRGAAQQFIQWANKTELPILSLDVPSGMDSTTAETPGDYIQASKTMTLALPKTGLIPQRTGQLVLADIGIPQAVYKKLGIDYVDPFGNQFLTNIQAQQNGE
jgi:NAD(P)H-hydrate epimerase